MKIAIMSDFHFGYGAGTELENDSFEAVRQALEASSSCDLIIMPGDLFDTRVPGTETLAKAMELMIKPSLSSNRARFVRFIGRDGSVSPRNLSGIPIITIHGTHERRTKELMNPVQALERAGFAIHLHCNGVVFEKNAQGDSAAGTTADAVGRSEAASDKVAVFGFSGVPDQYADAELKQWNPKPEPGCYNIFMLHQNIREFMPPQIEHAIKTEELPDGFDLYICGHIHEAQKAKKGGKPFLFPGSLVPTQLNKESTKPRGFFIVDTRSGSIGFVELEKQRRVFVIESGSREEIIREVEDALSKKQASRPLIRIKLPAVVDGNLSHELRLKYEGRAVLSIKQEASEDEEASKAMTLEEHVLSVQEMGRKLLDSNLRGANLNPGLYESLFELIVDGRMEEAERMALGQKEMMTTAIADNATKKGMDEKERAGDDAASSVKSSKAPKNQKTGSLLSFT